VAALPDVGGVTPQVRAGIAHHPTDGTDAPELLHAAQEALVAARAGDRGAIVGLRIGADTGVGAPS
jgi:hypothetical protein